MKMITMPNLSEEGLIPRANLDYDAPGLDPLSGPQRRAIERSLAEASGDPDDLHRWCRSHTTLLRPVVAFPARCGNVSSLRGTHEACRARPPAPRGRAAPRLKIGRASCRERV